MESRRTMNILSSSTSRPPPPVFHILRRLVMCLNVRCYETNRGCQIVPGRVVLTFSDIPREIRL